MTTFQFPRTYELKPNDGRKSFYGKAVVHVFPDGGEVLQSYRTPVMYRDPNGGFHRLWSGWSVTTGRHVRAFTNKAHYKHVWDSMPVEKAPRDYWL